MFDGSPPGTGVLRSVLTAPFRPQTYLNLLYLGLAFPLGVLYLVFVTVGLSLGVGLAVVLVGVPIILVVVGGALGIAAFERWLASLLLDVEFPAPQADADRAETGANRGPLRRVLSVLVDPATWKAVAYLPTKFVLGTAAFVFMTVVLSTAVSLLFAPLYYRQPGVYVGVVTDRPVELHPTLHFGWNRLLVTLDPVITVGAWRITRLPEALFVAALGAVVCLVGLHVLNWVAGLWGRWTGWMLGDGYDPVGAVRERLAD